MLHHILDRRAVAGVVGWGCCCAASLASCGSGGGSSRQRRLPVVRRHLNAAQPAAALGSSVGRLRRGCCCCLSVGGGAALPCGGEKNREKRIGTVMLRGGNPEHDACKCAAPKKTARAAVARCSGQEAGCRGRSGGGGETRCELCGGTVKRGTFNLGQSHYAQFPSHVRHEQASSSNLNIRGTVSAERDHSSRTNERWSFEGHRLL